VLEEDRVEIGRHARNAIVINDPCISNSHARLERTEDGAYILRDLNSDNGTFVNDRTITLCPLRHGDIVRFGICEADYEEDGQALEKDKDAQATQRITLEALAKESADFWTATVENKRRELEELERRIEALTTSGVHAGGGSAGIPQEDLSGMKTQREELLGDIARLESRRAEMQQLILEQDYQLEQLRKQEIPDARMKLEDMRGKVAHAHQELRELKSQIEESTLQMESLSGLQEEIGTLKSQIEALDLRHKEKVRTLESVAEDLAGKRQELADARAALEAVETKKEDQLNQTARSRDEHQDLLQKNQAAVAAIKAKEAELSEVQAEVDEAQQSLSLLTKQQKTAERELKLSEERLAVHKGRTEKALGQWEPAEREQIDELALEKRKLYEEIAAAKAELAATRDEATSVRSTIKAEQEDHRKSLEEMRATQYEPTRQHCEELTLRNEELSREISQRERFLEQLQRTIEESKATERIVSDSLATKGKQLDQLESRIGEEVERITYEAKEMSGLASPSNGEAPNTSEIGPIFFPKGDDTKPRSAPRVRTLPAPRTRLVVFDPGSSSQRLDYTECEDLHYDHPLPVGFHGLSAATHGALEVSLADAVKWELPVLYIPGEDLAENTKTLRKLRSALPTRILLLGWHAKTFLAMSDTLEKGTNFQDLAALLSMADGSITTDPYMNTFFDSLNQSRRFLYIPPTLPWNPRTFVPFEGRGNILVDPRDFHPGNADHSIMAQELRELSKSTGTALVLPKIDVEALPKLMEALGGPKTVKIVPAPENYKAHLDLLEQHLATATFDSVRFRSASLRDALLTRTLLIGRTSEPIQIFFPEAFPGRGPRLLPDANQIGSIIDSADNYHRVLDQAERKLFENYSYQATARLLDEFVDGLI